MTMPFVSILLVARNEKAHIERAIRSVLEQDYPKDRLELLIIDGMSDDGSFEVAEKIAKTQNLGLSVRIFQNPAKILAAGWNLGIKEAKGEIVCRFDVHGWPEPDYVSLGVQELMKRTREGVVCVGGILDNVGDGFWGNLIASIMSCPFGVGNSPFRIRNGERNGRFSDTAAMGLYLKKIFSTIGYFREDLKRNQDLDLHTRIRSQGFSFFTCPDMTFHYVVRNSILSFVKKGYSDGFWVGYSRKGYIRHWVPGIFILYLLGLTIFRSRNLKSLYFPLVSYVLLNVIFTLFCGKGPGKWFLPFLFFSLHASYGLGIIVGFSKSFFRKMC